MKFNLKKIAQSNRLYNFVIFLLFSVFLFLHLYKLDGTISVINIDEAGLWYNVKCLINYGTDQQNNSYPLLFANFYGEQSAMYTYLAFIFVKLFGDTLFAIRLPAAIGSILIFIFGYKIINELYLNNNLPISLKTIVNAKASSLLHIFLKYILLLIIFKYCDIINQ